MTPDTLTSGLVCYVPYVPAYAAIYTRTYQFTLGASDDGSKAAKYIFTDEHDRPYTVLGLELHNYHATELQATAALIGDLEELLATWRLRLVALEQQQNAAVEVA